MFFDGKKVINMKEICLQEKTGSCRGCPLLDKIAEKVNKTQEPIEDVALGVQKHQCLNGNRPQTHYVRTYRYGGMGQGRSGIIKVVGN